MRKRVRSVRVTLTSEDIVTLHHLLRREEERVGREAGAPDMSVEDRELFARVLAATISTTEKIRSAGRKLPELHGILRAG